MSVSEPSQPALRLPVVKQGAPARLCSHPLERMEVGEPLLDYTLVAYDPVEDPVGKLRSINCLVESFAISGVEREGVQLIERLRASFGRNRTVWGTKWSLPSAPRGWELYFYDPERAHPDVQLASLRTILSPTVEVDAQLPADLPWHMFSVEFDASRMRSGQPGPADVYVSTNPRNKGSDRSYKVRGDKLEFENVYTFHQPGPEVDEILYRLEHGVHYNPQRHRLSMLIPPQLLACTHICIANKRCADAIYFCGLETAQLLIALAHFGVRGPLVDYLRGYATEFGHLRWDIGVDFVADQGSLRFTKVGLYGAF